MSDIMGKALASGAWCGSADVHLPHGMCHGINACPDTFVHDPHLGCEGRTAPAPPAPAPVPVSTGWKCYRCGDRRPAPEVRRLWGSAITVDLCSPCNDLTQGPDWVDIETENLAWPPSVHASCSTTTLIQVS